MTIQRTCACRGLCVRADRDFSAFCESWGGLTCDGSAAACDRRGKGTTTFSNASASEMGGWVNCGTSGEHDGEPRLVAKSTAHTDPGEPVQIPQIATATMNRRILDQSSLQVKRIRASRQSALPHGEQEPWTSYCPLRAIRRLCHSGCSGTDVNLTRDRSANALSPCVK